MNIQNLHVVFSPEIQLQISWTTMCKVQAIQVDVAHNSLFTQNAHSFLFPESTQSCKLDVGDGEWFLRVAAWIGDKVSGRVNWSGVVGPITLEKVKSPLPNQTNSYEIKKIQLLENGVRCYTLNPNPNFMYIEVSPNPSLESSETECFYAYDWGRGFIEQLGLSEHITHHLRLSPFSGYPTNSIQKLVKSTQSISVKPLPINKAHTGFDQAQTKQEKILIREAKANPNLRFSSYSDYMRLTTSRVKY
jgi:hypothetical protein